MHTIHKQALDNTEAIQTIFSILRGGHSVELPATGLSMFPTFRPGDRVVVRPVRKDEMPEKGMVVVYIEKDARVLRSFSEGGGRNGVEEENGTGEEEFSGKFIMHRLIRIREDESGERWCITRGDSRREADRPWPLQQLIGVAVSYRSGKREKRVKSYIPSEFRYKLNWWLLWGGGKLVRV